MIGDRICVSFFRVDNGCVELVTADELSQNVLAGPSEGTPNICSL
jgi:hypothetical protein